MTERPPTYRRVVTVHDAAQAERCSHGRVILIDDDPDILASLLALVQLKGFYGECHGGADAFLTQLALDQPFFPGPVCVVSDVRMPDVDGLELLRRLREQAAYPLVLMSGNSGIRDAIEAFQLGVVDFLVKPFESIAFLQAVNKALRLHTDQQQKAADGRGVQSRVASLSERERTVVTQVAEGRRNRDIAQQLGITERMVKINRQNAMKKLQIGHVTELVRLLDQAGLLR